MSFLDHGAPKWILQGTWPKTNPFSMIAKFRHSNICCSYKMSLNHRLNCALWYTSLYWYLVRQGQSSTCLWTFQCLDLLFDDTLGSTSSKFHLWTSCLGYFQRLEGHHFEHKTFWGRRIVPRMGFSRLHHQSLGCRISPLRYKEEYLDKVCMRCQQLLKSSFALKYQCTSLS